MTHEDQLHPGLLHSDLLHLTTSVVVAQIAAAPGPDDDIPALIRSVFGALQGLGTTQPVEERPEPAVSIRASVKPDHIVCLEDGKKLKMLKRYLMTQYGMTPEQYRTRWNLPADYPMVAPAYSEKRAQLARDSGLGRKKAPA